MDMLTHVKKRLAARKETLEQIAQGANVTYTWLTKFNAGRIPNPGYENVKLLDSYFRKAAN